MGIPRLYSGCLLACVFCFHFHHDVRDILPICVLQIILINSTKIYNILFISMTRIKIHSFWKISGMKEWFIFSMMLFSTTYIKRENVYPLTTFPHVYHPLVPSNNAFTEWNILLLMKIYSIHLCVSGLMHNIFQDILCLVYRDLPFMATNIKSIMPYIHVSFRHLGFLHILT